jgi:hypothetical protein
MPYRHRRRNICDYGSHRFVEKTSTTEWQNWQCADCGKAPLFYAHQCTYCSHMVCHTCSVGN